MRKFLATISILSIFIGFLKADSDDCNATTHFQNATTKLKKETIMSETMCCEYTYTGNELINKVCKNERHVIQWVNDEETGKLYKATETYRKGDQICTKSFSPDGKLEDEKCGKSIP